MTEALLVGIRGAYREKKIESEGKKFERHRFERCRARASQPNAPIK
jgi:hypothetical protein